VKLTEVIPKRAIVPNIKAKDKKGALTELVQVVHRVQEAGKFSVSEIVEGILQREKLGSTGIGGGVAVPHAKLEGLKGVVGAFGRSAAGLDFNAVDGEAVHLIFLIIGPPDKNEEYLQSLQKVMMAIKRPNFLRFLRAAKTAKEIEEIFREAEEPAAV